MSTRTYARVDLRLDGDWRVGTWEAGDTETADGALVTIATVADRPYLPGSSLRGALRAHLEQALGKARTSAGFGPLVGVTELVASRWWVLAAELVTDTWQRAERGQTGMDRDRRAPDTRTYRTSESVMAVGAGPHVRLYLRCDAPADSAVARDVLAALLAWRPRVGAGKSAGMGRARVVAVAHREVSLDSRDGLLAALEAGGGPRGLDDLLADPQAVASTVRAAADDVLLACDFDVPDGWAAPEQEDRPGRVLMNGSTWKGLIRSRVEFIGRSLGATVCGSGADGVPTQPCEICDVCTTFGSPRAAALLEFASVPIDRARAKRGRRQRVALDRFTGGANDKKLFVQGEERGVRLRLEIRTLPRPRAPQPPRWVVRAILHAVRDLADGLIGVGPASSTGLGTLSASSCRAGTAWSGHVIDMVQDAGTIALRDLDRSPVEVSV